MARLRMLKPLVREMSPAVRIQQVTYDQDRRKIEWRKWYGLARWKAIPSGARWRCLLRDLFTCQMCGHIESNSSLLVADHKQPHRGDPELFWDDDNLQTLCKPCHDSEKQRSEQGQR